MTCMWVDVCMYVWMYVCMSCMYGWKIFQRNPNLTQKYFLGYTLVFCMWYQTNKLTCSITVSTSLPLSPTGLIQRLCVESNEIELVVYINCNTTACTLLTLIGSSVSWNIPTLRCCCFKFFSVLFRNAELTLTKSWTMIYHPPFTASRCRHQLCSYSFALQSRVHHTHKGAPLGAPLLLALRSFKQNVIL